tara:strand:+ start:1054 stop:1791 length:738 start_codon:yes stop_codon:yes gene_type:complete
MALHEQVHSVPRFSDHLIIIGLFNWSGWKILKDCIFNRTIRLWQFLFVLLVRNISILTEVFAFPLRCIFRHKAGRLGGGGFILTLLSLWVMVLWNNESSLHGYWSYISQSATLLFTFFFGTSYDHLQLSDVIVALWQPQSEFLSIFICVFIIAALGHILARMFGYRNSNPWSKGSSFVYDLAHKYVGVSRSYCEVLWEASITILIAWIIYHEHGDFRMALYLWIAAGALFVQELADYLMQSPFKK